MISSKLRISAFVLIALLAIGAMLFALVTSSTSGGSRIQKLADGSMLEIRQVTLASDFQYKHQSGPRLLRLVEPILPTFIKNRLALSSGSFGFGSDGNTNLFVITVNSSQAQGRWSDLGSRLVVFDELGNSHDGCWGASTLGMPGEVVHGWQIHAFPRRSKTLGLRFLSQGTNSRWEVAAEFQIPNPAMRNHSQWTPEPWPVTRSDGDLEVTLREFQAGAPFDFRGKAGDEKTAPRQTHAGFELRQAGQSATNWTIQKITISDASGNRWSPFLGYGLGSVTNGILEFAGALWPGENAWKLDVEFVRTSGFTPDELWESPSIPIPTAGVATNFNARFQHDGATVELVGLASPQTDHPDPFKWIAKYWGDEDKTKIVSLAVRISPALDKRRLKLLRAVDQNGRDARQVEHRNEDHAEQAFLLNPDDGATTLKLIFALQRSRFVQFIARPQFIGPEISSAAGDAR
jgi:hypothetical protein